MHHEHIATKSVQVFQKAEVRPLPPHNCQLPDSNFQTAKTQHYDPAWISVNRCGVNHAHKILLMPKALMWLQSIYW